MATPTSSSALPRAFLVMLAIVLLANLTLVAPYLLALFLGWIISTVLRPFYRRFTARFRRPKLAALLSTLLATFTIILPIGGLGFVTVKNVIRLAEPYVKSGVHADEWLAKVQRVPLVNRIFDDPEELRAFAEDNGKKVVGRVSEGATGFLADLPELALQLVLALLGCYFFLLRSAELCAWMSPRMPLDLATQSDLSRKLADIAYSSFLSMFFASLAQSLVVFIAFLVLKVPLATLALGVAFVFAWFPIFGVTPVWFSALVYLLLVDRPGAALGMAAFGILASISDNVVRPWVIKGRDDMHPLVSLVAIFGAIRFFGIVGVLVGPVLAACAIEFLKLWPPFAAKLGLKPSGAD